MKKTFKYFLIVWAICFAVFNAVTFAFPRVMFEIDRYKEPVFWMSYAVIDVCFLCQILVAWFFCNTEKNDKLFLRIPLLQTSITAVIVMMIVGGVFMVLPIIPTWIAIIVCVIIFAVYLIAAIKAKAAADIVGGIDDKIKAQTAFIRLATVDAEMLVNRAATEDIKAEAKKVYEAIRYSDPMSNPALAGVESEISKHIEALKASVAESDAEAVKAQTSELILLVKERNSKCKLLK